MADGAKVRTVSDLMTSDVLTATPSETIAEVSSRMGDRKVGSIVVVDDARPVGILTERDMIKIAASGTDTSIAKVSEWMTEDPDTVEPDVGVDDAFHRLTEHGYRHMPVVKDGKLLGIVSLRDLVRIAQIRPVEHPSLMEAPKGLEGVVVAETEIGDVRGQEGFYHYRQYNAVELAEKRTLEDVWFLLYYGHLPTKDELKKFIEEKRQYREVPEKVKALLPGIANAGDHFIPLDALRTAVSLVAYAQDYKPSLDIDAKELRHNALQITSVIPTLIMSLYRLNKGQEPIDPNPDLPYSANYLYMLTGEVPDPENARAVEQYQISTIDHGFNASTFTARVITSTGADLGAAVVGAIGALSGPLHGGAPSRALDMLDAIGKPENAEPWVRDAVEHGKRIMGFGHRVYKTEDPRSRMLKGVAERIGGENVEFAKHIEQTVVDVLAELKPGRQLYANVEFYAGVVMDKAGLPRDLFTPTFASSRVIGWTAHILEQAADNRLIRPSAHYAGPPPPQPVPDPE
ncbi:MAG: citrate synthase [Acidimicrobiia bacterium]|nr:citrate synthase [Acidimicrobiia bacterium]